MIIPRAGEVPKITLAVGAPLTRLFLEPQKTAATSSWVEIEGPARQRGQGQDRYRKAATSSEGSSKGRALPRVQKPLVTAPQNAE